MAFRRPPSERRRRAVRRDVLGTLGLGAAIFVSIIALPFGRVHEGACRIVSELADRAVPCGLTALNISIDTDRRPFVSIAVTPLKLPISL